MLGAAGPRPQGAAQGGVRGDSQGGLVAGRVDGEVLDVEHPPELEPRKNHTIEAVVDRIVIREGIGDRLAESIQLALSHGEGTLVASYQSVTRQTAAAKGAVSNKRLAAVARRAVQHALRLPELQDQLRGDRAAHVQLQQPLRRLPGVRRAWARAWSSIRSWCLPTQTLSLAERRAWRPGRERRQRRLERDRAGEFEPFLAREQTRVGYAAGRVEAGGD